MSQIASVILPGRGDTDVLLHSFATRMLAKGLRVRGLVQINAARTDGQKCDMDVQVLPDGAAFRISQALGQGARGCRLNSEALELSVAAVAATVRDGADLFILNKFGKQEAEGRGYRHLLADVVSMGIPVLVGLNALNREAFYHFAGDYAQPCPPTLRALERWAAAISRQDCTAA